MIAKGAEINPQIASTIPTIEAQFNDAFTIGDYFKKIFKIALLLGLNYFIFFCSVN